MKKLIALILILIITPFLVSSEKALVTEALEISKHNTMIPETANWEYVKDRIFDGETSFFGRLEGPISITLEEATKEDSLLLEETISDIREILPNKEIRILKPSSKITEPWIHIRFISESIYTNPNKQIIDLANGHFLEIPWNVRKGNKLEIRPYMKVYLPEERSYVINSHEVRKKSLKAGLLRKLVFLQNDSEVEGRSLFRNKKITSLDFFIKDRDKFLLQKLYSDDFLTQFEDYLYTYYPWRYAYSFLSKEKMKMLAISTVTAIGIIVFILLFSLYRNRKFKHDYFNYLFPMVFIAFHLINLKWIYEYLTVFNSSITWSGDIMFSLIFIGPLAIISATLLYFLERIFIKKSFDFSYKLILKITFTFIALHLPLLIFMYLLNDKVTLKDVNFLEFYFPWFIISIFLSLGRGILIYLNHFSESLVKQKDVELSRLKELNAQSELKLLQSHINPHFLYNALNSIAGLAKDDADKTEKMALSLSDLFRYSINKKGEKMSTVAEEVALVENYLEIEKIRFGERLKFTLKVDEVAKEEKIPMFMLQPLVENAIKHGISKIGGEARVGLNIKKEKETLLISVSDNGPDFPEGLVSGHGLQTVYDLLRLSYGKNASLSWKNSPKKQILIDIKKNNAHD
ncbi:Histidine kinase [Salegentibacter holothuriorum]|uniref:Histidine kinase n=1 Tax=Salegentibacter holothuriorum TaxID=241145 RepID=A0A1T5DGE8_9FLAO|nr:histidine kinase [Salegentibacter holothuriorum]SKB70550.1 Histidine kinase [Salegentibacter holothuriorum]